jgi:hypothetical protein
MQRIKLPPSGYVSICLSTLLLCLTPTTARAQIELGNIRGTVTDQSDAALPGVTVTVKNDATGQVRTIVTGADGHYVVAGLPPAKYLLTAELSGFGTVQRSDITVNVAAIIDVNVSMKVAAVSETITVSGSAPLVESGKTEISNVVTSEMIEALPSLHRDYLDLTLLQPATNDTVVNGENGSGFEVGGAKGHQSALLLDGFYNLDIAFIQPKTRPSEDLIQEFQMETFGGSAEYGRAIGGVVNVVTKSGSNNFRGSAYGFFQNTALNAEDFLAASQGQPKPDYNRKQYGGVFGGPVMKDKSFFIGSFENLNLQAPVSTGITQASIAAIGLPASASVMPKELVTSFAFGKWEYNINSNQRLQANFSYTKQNDTVSWILTQTVGSRYFDLHPTDYIVGFKWQGISGDGKVMNEAKFEYFPRRYYVTGLQQSGEPLCNCMLNASFPNLPSDPPNVTISGVASFGSAGLSDRFNTDPVQVVYTSTMFKNNHTIKFGADYLYGPQSYELYSALEGRYTFSSLQNYLAGKYSQFVQQFPVAADCGTNIFSPTNLEGCGVALPRTWQMISGFVQDSWRLNERLTMNLGFRYDLDLPVHYWLTNTPFGQTDYKDFGPRVGLSFDLTGRRKTFLKASSGMFYDRIWGNDSNNMFLYENYPERVSVTWTPTTLGAPVYPQVFSTAPATIAPGSVSPMIMPTKALTPRTLQSIARLEHLLTPTLSLSVSGVFDQTWHNPFTLDTNLGWNPDLNNGQGGYYRINPQYFRITQVNYGATGRYLAGIVQLEQRRKRLGYSAVLTLARARDVESVDDPHTFQTQGFAPFYGPNPDTPTVSGKVSGYFSINSGIQLSGSFRGRSGVPVNPVAGGIDVYGNGVLSLRPPQLAPYSFLTPPTYEVDARLSWFVPFTSSRNRRVELFLEGFNLLNHPNVETVQNNYGAKIGSPLPGFLNPLLYFPPRDVQLGVRMRF